MICIQICSNLEWDSLKDIFYVSEESILITPYGESIHRIVSGHECIFFHSGATKTKSSGAAQYAISTWQPDFLFVLGSCGGVSEDLNTLDIVIANKTAQYDCILTIGGPSKLFFDFFLEDIDNSWIDFDRLSIQLHEGFIATADQDVSTRQVDELKDADVLCADWESGAISHICRLNGIKLCILRGITDIPFKGHSDSDELQAEDYQVNTPKVMVKLLNTVLPELLEQLQP